MPELKIYDMNVPLPASYKPFNIEAALAGEPVLNRLGEPRFIAKIAKAFDKGKQLLVQDESGTIMSYNFIDGSRASYGSEYDLFMAPTLVTKWVNLYANGHCYFFGSQLDADESVDRLRFDTRIGKKAHQITYEE